MPLIGVPALIAPRRSTATPRLNLPRSTILISRSPPPGALTTFWISSALTMVATSFCACENVMACASTNTMANDPDTRRCISCPFQVCCRLLRAGGRRQPENLRWIDLEQLRELLLGEAARTQHLRTFSER